MPISRGRRRQRSAPNKSFIELREMINSSSVNLMREFSTACREEFETLRTV
jgi:hypothetical protein